MISIKKSLCAAAFFLASQHAYTQATQAIIDPDRDFKMAKEFFQKEQFSLAYPLFKNISLLTSPYSKLPISVQLESKYYALVCGLMLNESASEEAAKAFIAGEYNTPRNQMLSYHLGEYYFRRQQFTDALDYFEKATIDNLSNRDIAQMKFHQAYAYFTLQRFAEARPLFDAIRQMPDDPNYLDANYYFGFISFYEKNYGVALESFRKVEQEPTYATIVPYYITEILYFSGRKDEAIEYGERKLNAGGQYYANQLRQLVGHAYFEKKNYQKALPYLEEYVENADKVRREDLYELAYTHYETRQYAKAIAGFKELGGKEDSLAQNSMYLLADAYLKTNQKANARNAFLFSATNNSNPLQQQIARFHYAKLSYELGFQDIALSELQSFITAYPSSTYLAEAKELLVNVLANTNNYQDALTLYSSLQGKSESVRRVYPKILYGRAVELINDQQLNQADNLLDELLAQPYNQSQLPFAHFWKGEIAYRQSRLDPAINHLEDYLKNPATNGEVNVTNARYNLGHIYLRKENYRQALQNFEQVTRSLTAGTTPVEQDAYIRSADAYFMSRNFTKAQAMYDAAINNNLRAADHATYQKALIAGASNRTSEKVSLLQSVEQRYPNSALVADAILELSDTYMAEENYRAAVSQLDRLLRDRRYASLHPQAYLKTGVAHFNLNNNDEALTSFKTLVSTYPNSAESDVAVEYVRTIFVDQQRPGEFVTFMRQNGKQISFNEEDSLNYAAANISFQNRNFDEAINHFKSYLNKFPNGRYAIEANYNIAEIYNSRKEFENALIGYSYVAERAPNKYAERAVLQAARINYFEVKNYDLAEQYFTQLKQIATDASNRLESMRGLLRAQYKLNKWREAVPNAQDLLEQKGIATDDRMMANMAIAKNHHFNNRLPEATSVYRTVINLGKSEFAAEARYQLAAILFTQNNFDTAEKAAFDVINKAGSYEYWTTKAYILLGDIYWKQKDYFNAEATLKSVAENATIAELKEEAQVKLDALVDEKNQNSKVEQ